MSLKGLFLCYNTYKQTFSAQPFFSPLSWCEYDFPRDKNTWLLLQMCYYRNGSINIALIYTDLPPELLFGPNLNGFESVNLTPWIHLHIIGTYNLCPSQYPLAPYPHASITQALTHFSGNLLRCARQKKKKNVWVCERARRREEGHVGLLMALSLQLCMRGCVCLCVTLDSSLLTEWPFNPSGQYCLSLLASPLDRGLRKKKKKQGRAKCHFTPTTVH